VDWGFGEAENIVSSQSGTNTFPSRWTSSVNVLIEVAIAETAKTTHKSLRFCKDLRSHCRIGHSDSLFWSIFFTTFVALAEHCRCTSLPVATPIEAMTEASSPMVASLFTWCYIGFGAVLQVPLVQVLRSWLSVPVLTISMLLWGIGFC